MKMRKNILVVITCVTLFVFSCTGVSAKNAADWFAPINHKMINNSTGVIGTLKSSKLSSAGHKFIENYINCVGNYFVCSYANYIIFVLVPSNIKASNIVYNPQYDGLVFNYGFDYVSFDAITGLPINDLGTNASYANYINFLDYQYLINLGYSETSIPNIWKPIKLGKKLVVNFDDILKPEPPVSSEPEPPVSSEPEPPVSSEPEPPVSSEPEPPVSSEPEPPVSSEPEPPVSSEPEPPVSSTPSLPDPLPIDEDYLGISPSTVSNVFTYITDTIGTAVDNGWIILIYLSGIIITIKVIKYLLGE